jgi:carbon monoxide dehydrogenase subunit G
MNTTYTTKATINASIEDAWEAITKPSFVKEFLPEIKKNINEMSSYVRTTHRNAENVQPCYAVYGQALGWNKVAGTDIRLPRKDVEANIDAVDIKLEERGNNTRIIVEVTYNPRVGKNYLLAHRCIRGLFNIKLNVLKKELEANTDRTQLTPAFA